MQKRFPAWTATLFAASFALAGCMKSGEDATGQAPGIEPVLDAAHGGARIQLPEIDPAALGKAGPDTSLPDTGAKAWFELSISGEGMKEMFYRFPLTDKGGQAFEIKGIPAGAKRSFHGSLLNAGRVPTHEGITVADIKGGAFTDVRLYLAKAGGSANVCVVIEGQKPPACAGDTLKPPPNPWPLPDSAAIGGCWQFASGWVSGKVKLYQTPVNGYKGFLLRDSGAALPITTWARHGDTLAAILISPDGQGKWTIYGLVSGGGAAWTGTITSYLIGKSTSFAAKTLPCELVVDPGKIPSDSVPPKPEPGSAGSIPMPGSGAKQTTLCFEMRFDYGTGACELPGYAKMDFLEGKILFGNMTVADRPARTYTKFMGQYDSSAISFYGISETGIGGVFDTLSLKGIVGIGGTMAKGDYTRWPSAKKGNWSMKVVTCGSWTPAYVDSACVSAPK